MSIIRIVAVVALALAVLATAKNCKTHPWPYTNTLTIGDSLPVGGVLTTSTSYLTVEVVGRVALYKGAPPSTATLLWSTGTTGSPANLTVTPTGNLVLFAVDGSIIWQSSTSAAFDANFVLQDDCNFVLYQEAPLTNATWATGTSFCVVAHIVPHSHDDVGWLLTPERYYDGCYDPTGGVQSIISSMVTALAANSSRTFAQVESYYFNRWWERQTESMKATCRQVVANGQFDFINGGWSMHDEACVHQESAVSNMDVGAQFLRNEFGNTMNLTIGWHIDPFGHASATPRLMAQMGFDAFFFWRTDYELRNYNLQTKKMETMWSSSPSLGDEVLMFTSILYNSYCYGCNDNMCPSPFCCMNCEQDHLPNWAHYFERIEASTKPKTSRHMIEKMFNVNASSGLSIPELASAYVQTILSYAGGFRTNNVLMPWGCDFQHIDASISFALMDEVMTEVNGNWNKYHVEMKYSTPERYTKAVQQLGYSWPINEYDYFLDSDDGHAYWSGYFSSRAEYKHFERWLMNERVASEIALSAAYRADFSLQRQRMDVFRQALGVAQHHDSITGTEREHVRNRYQFLLTEGLMNASATVNDVFTSATGATAAQPCHLSNLSSCDLTNPLAAGKPVSVFIYNGLAWARNEIITIPVPTKTLGAILNLGNTTSAIVSQVSDTWDLTLSRDPTSPPHAVHPYELIFSVSLPPLSLIEVILTPTPSSSAAVYVKGTQGASTISSDKYSVAFTASTGRIANVTNKATGLSSPVEQNVMFYCPMGPEGGQASGAYIFRTCTPDAKPEPFQTTFVSAATLVGPVCSEVRQYINAEHHIHQTVRLCHGQDYVDLITGVGEINPGTTGKEVILRVATDVQSGGEFYTDSQGLELQRRIRNDHPNFPYTVTEPVAANFYPCNVYAVVKDAVKSLAVITDYSRSTSSMEDGELEFLFIRRLIHDDNRGVAQPLNESIRVLSSSRLVMNSANVLADARLQSILHAHKPLVRFGAGGQHTIAPAFSNSVALPPAITLHTRTAVGGNYTMIRLQHIYAVGESPLAVPTTVDLKSVVPKGSSIVSVVETDLNGISLLGSSSSNRLQFNACDESTGTSRVGPTPIKSSIVSGTLVQLVPMDIRTYIVHLAYA